MRSRYTAFALGHADHLFRTWHPRTRPADTGAGPALGTDGATTWTGLRILSVTAGGETDAEGRVVFTASYRDETGAHTMTEDSAFTRRAGRWVYVDGEHTALEEDR